MVLRNLIIKILPDDNLETLAIRLCEQIPGMVKQLIANLDSIVEDLTKKKKQDTFASYEKKVHNKDDEKSDAPDGNDTHV